MTPEITPSQKLAAFRLAFFTISCQIPKSYWGTEHEAEFYRARELTGPTEFQTDWMLIARECKGNVVWEAAIVVAKGMLGIKE